MPGMRFCPFCAQENSDDASECAHCGRKLPLVATMPAAPTTRSVSALPPRRIPRPLSPRPRPMTPAPALPARPEAAVEAAVSEAVPQVVKDSTSRARSGTLLGIPAAKPLDLDAATRVEGPSLKHDAPRERVDDDALTDQVPRYGDPASSLAIHTVPDLGSTLPTSAAESSDLTDAQISAPPVHVPASSPRPRGGGVAPPVPLPPPPTTKRPALARLSLSEPISLGDLGSPLPEAPRPMLPEGDPLDLPTRATRMPTQSHAFPVAMPAGDVAPMPPHPPATIWPSVLYLAPLLRAIWERHKAQRALRGLLHDDQRRVDQALRDLGEAAWKMEPRPPELRPDLDRADADEGKRVVAEQELARLELAVAAERRRWTDDELHRNSELGKHQNEVQKLVEQMAEQRRAQKGEEQALRALELARAGAERAMQKHLARATKADATPAAKGGGAAAAATAREQAEQARAEIDGYAPQVDAQHEKVRAYDAPLAELEKHLADERQQVAAQQADLETARGANAQTLAALELEHDQQDATRLAAERGVRLRLVATGTLLSLHRMGDTQSGGVFSPLYRTLDELRTVASQRESRIAQLEEDRRSYDHAAVQRGLIVVGGALGLLAILAIVLIVLVRR